MKEIKKVKDRPMTRELSELPMKNGYHFYGIDRGGNRRRCVTKISDVVNGVIEIYPCSSWQGALIGWQPYK